MGILRLYLALCIIEAHSAHDILPWKTHSPIEAVQIFFIISGFYMAMVLSSARYESVRDFYLSRFLRIFPVYWLVLVGVIAWSVLFGLATGHWLALAPFLDRPLDHNGLAGIVVTSLTNLTLFGQDWIMFLSQEPGRPLALTAHFLRDPDGLWHYLLIPPCWSVGIEITFYAFVPWLNRWPTVWLLALAGLSTAARFFYYSQAGGGEDPWIYRFFPFELAMFLFGMLAFRLYARTSRFYPASLRLVSTRAYFAGGAVLLIALFLHAWLADFLIAGAPAGVGVFLSDAICALALPFLFFAFGNQPWDRQVGELSYPVYLVHWTVIATLVQIYALLHGDHQHFIAQVAAFFSILLAMILYKFCIGPLDRKRHRFARE